MININFSPRIENQKADVDKSNNMDNTHDFLIGGSKINVQKNPNSFLSKPFPLSSNNPEYIPGYYKGRKRKSVYNNNNSLYIEAYNTKLNFFKDTAGEYSDILFDFCSICKRFNRNRKIPSKKIYYDAIKIIIEDYLDIKNYLSLIKVVEDLKKKYSKPDKDNIIKWLIFEGIWLGEVLIKLFSLLKPLKLL